MKIAQISPLIENTGGHRILYEHIRGLRKLGHSVDIYASGWAGTRNADWLELSDIIFYKSIIDGSPSSFQLKLKKDYDVVIGNMLSGAEEILNLDHSNKVYFYQNHDCFVFRDRTPTLAQKANEMYKKFNKHLIYSHELKKIVQKIAPNAHIRVCTNGIDYKRFEPYQKTIKNNKRICYMAAYQGVLKGSTLAAEVFCELKKRGFTTVCIMANHGPIAHSDEFYANPPFEEKCQLVAGCSVFLHPSIFETWCLATMEAMALGTPIIGTDSLGIREYMNKNNSVIVERQSKIICNEIEALLQDKNRYDKLVDNSIKTAQEHDWDLVMPKIEQTYKELI
jgi:glycosyltransferase involved in cell wall biosynthesis